MDRMPEINMKRTGQNIARLRKARGLSVKEVAEKLMLSSTQTVYQWESGQTLPSVDNLVLLAHLFEVSVDELLIKEFHVQQKKK